MLEILIPLILIPIAGIAGWASVARAKALGGQRGGEDAETMRQMAELRDAVAGLRGEIDQLAAQNESDHQLLEERLDSTERLLTRGRGDAS